MRKKFFFLAHTYRFELKNVLINSIIFGIHNFLLYTWLYREYLRKNWKSPREQKSCHKFVWLWLPSWYIVLMSNICWNFFLLKIFSITEKIIMLSLQNFLKAWIFSVSLCRLSNSLRALFKKLWTVQCSFCQFLLIWKEKWIKSLITSTESCFLYSSIIYNNYSKNYPWSIISKILNYWYNHQNWLQ